jgi:hypothetical protein
VLGPVFSLFLLKLTYNNQVINGKFGKTSSNENPHSPDFGSSGSYYIHYDSLQLRFQSMFIPILYGYSLFGKSNFFTLTPFIGWVNRSEIDVYYSVSIIAGFRMRIKCFYLNCFYRRMLTKFDEEFSTHLQIVNLSVG